MSIENSLTSNQAIDRASQQQASMSPNKRASLEAGHLEKRVVEESKSVDKAQKMDPEKEAMLVQEAAEQLGDFLNVISSELNISVDKDVNKTVVKVVNQSTDEVIRQIPSEEILALMRRMGEIANQANADQQGSGNTGLLLSDEV